MLGQEKPNRPAARLLRGFLALAFLVFSVCACRAVLVLKIDYITGYPPSLMRSSDGRTLEGVYEAADIRTIVRQTEIRNPNGTPGTCLDDASLDFILKGPSQISPTSGSVASSPIQEDVWSAHGLIVPCCTGAIRGGNCGDYTGLIWLDLTQIRKNFVVFHVPLQQSDGLTATTVHELGHVLNLHHCEIDEDGLDANMALGPECLRHFREDSDECLMPGPKGLPWGNVDPLHASRHMDLNCTADEFSIKSEAPGGESMEGATLTVAAEKDSYLPGEPVRVNVVLGPNPRSAATDLQYLSELSLDPELGYLTLWAGESITGMRRLKTMTLAEAKLALRPLDGSVSATGLDVWFALPVAEIESTKPFHVKATYAGFGDGSTMISSRPILINVAGAPGPPLFDPTAYELFKDTGARRFLYFLGGDHLADGMHKLERISEEFPESIYATYANLALGVSAALPFYSYQNEMDGIIERPPLWEKAARYLVRANATSGNLAPSYRIVLHEALALTSRMLGDQIAGPDPDASLAHYSEAREQLQAILAMDSSSRPLSRRERTAKDEAASELRLLEEKIRLLATRGSNP